MTTIIIDGKTKKVFSDSRCTATHKTLLGKYLGEEYITGYQKIYEFSDCLVVGCGSATDLQCVVKSLSYGLKLPKRFLNWNTNVYIVSKKDDAILLKKLTNKKSKLGIQYLSITEDLVGSEHAWFDGSGSDYAKGAFHHGANPLEAIVAASKCDKYTDDNVVWLEIPGFYS